MFVVIAYDIEDDTRRNRVCKALKAFADRVQKSVFEGEMDERKFQKMRQKVESLLDKKKDLLRYYLLCEGCRAKVISAGAYVVAARRKVIVV